MYRYMESPKHSGKFLFSVTDSLCCKLGDRCLSLSSAFFSCSIQILITLSCNGLISLDHTVVLVVSGVPLAMTDQLFNDAPSGVGSGVCECP